MSGTFYEAYDNVLETNVVLKEMVVNLEKVTTAAQQENRRLTFADRAKMLLEIKHESLLHVYDYFSEIDRQYLVMESIGGHNLKEIIEKDKNPIATSLVINWADQLLDALHCLHTRIPPIIHGDIKPQNIKLASNGKIKLLALSLSKNPEAKVNSSAKNQAPVDSLHYLPLEQLWEGLDAASKKVILNNYDEKSEKILEQPIDSRSDIYSLGAVLYHLLTARLPIDALERSIDILEDKPDPLPTPTKLNPNVPPEISEVLMTALEIRRENRFSSAVIMRQILRTALLKVKERDAEEARKKAEADREAILMEQKALERERQLAEQEKLEKERKLAAEKKLEIEAEQKRQEAEQKRQIELIEQQLREAEAKRLEAEARAAAAEKLLKEKEAAKSVNEEIINLGDSDLLEIEHDELLELSVQEVSPEIVETIVETAKPVETIVETAKPVEMAEPVETLEPVVTVETIETIETEEPAEPVTYTEEVSPAETAEPVIVQQSVTPPAVQDNEFETLFAEPVRDNRMFKRMAAVAVCLLVLGGAGWGIFSLKSAQPADTGQTISNQPATSVEAAKPAPNVDSTSPSTVQTTSEINTTTALSTEAAENTDGSTEDKNKAFSPSSSKTKKQPAAKAPTQKKAVTVEDIIHDN